MSVREIEEGWLVECDEANCRSRDRLYFEERPSEALIRAYGWESARIRGHRCEECAGTGEGLAAPSRADRRDGPVSGAPALFGAPAYPEAFEELWRVFGKLVHKHAAYLEWKRLRKVGHLPEHEDLLAAIAAQHESERWQAGVQPDFRTWLHQMRWADDPAQMTWSSKPNGNGKHDRPPKGYLYTAGEIAGWPRLDKWGRQVFMENIGLEQPRRRVLQEEGREEFVTT